MKALEESKETVVSIGYSMFPLMEGAEFLNVVPYENKEIKIGDIIVFSPNGEEKKIVHRVIDKDSSGIRTKGDNNEKIDPWIVSKGEIHGQVRSIIRGKKKIKIYGGIVGYCLGKFFHIRKKFKNASINLLHPLYNKLSNINIFKKHLTKLMKIRLITINKGKDTEFQLIFGNKIIGRRQSPTQSWIIKRPYRLLIDEKILSTN